MTKLRKYTGKASGWSVYLFLAVGSHNIIAGWVHAQPVSFVTARRFSTGLNPASVGVGDFNQDGNRDLAVANSGSSNVSVLLGNGDGTFQTAVNYPVGGSPNSVVVSYFNGDAIQDLAVASSVSPTSTSVSVLLGNGNGTFQPAMSFAAGGVGLPLTHGDFNNDTFQDVVIGSISPFMMGVVLLGNGDGTLRAPRNVPIGGSSMVAGYFNNDGILDIADVASVFNRVRVHLGNGDGTFRPPQSISGVRGPQTIESGRFNRDVIADLVVADVDSGDVSVLLGNGDGSFRPGGFSGLLLPGPFAIDDFNGDTIEDLAHGSALGGVGVALGLGDGSFRQPRISTAPSGPVLAVGEFNSDGVKDVVTTDADGVSILLGYGDGTFRGTWIYDLETGMRPLSTFLRPMVARGEFNRDGIQDLAVAIPGIPGRIGVLLGSGDGSFRFVFQFEAGEAAALEVGDFNGDGNQDLVMPGALFLGNGNGTFQPPLSFPGVDALSGIAVGFLNGDGFLDLALVSRSTSSISVLLGNGNGTFQAPLSFDTGAPASFPEERSVALGDLNGDGSLDLVATNASAGSISVLVGNGDGTFRAPLLFDTGRDPVFVAVGDFNRDQFLDVAVASPSIGILVLLGNGNGTLRIPSTVGMSAEAIARGDFNSDGIDDLAATGSSLPGTLVLLGNGNGTFQPPLVFETASGSSLLAGEFSGDGRQDLAVAGNLDAFFFRINTLSALINATPAPGPTLEPLELTATGK
jgi:FG-GAP-like repeat